MFKRLRERFSQDIGIDLGTANTLIYIRDQGIVINEPSVVAINTRTDQILAVGKQAQEMVGKTPGHIIASKPLVAGVISDFEVTEKMLKFFFTKIHQKRWGIMPRPRVVIGVPLDITEVERKAVEDAVLGAGAREVFLVEEPMAAAIGSRLPVQQAVGNMIIDIGGGTTDIAVISLGGIVTSKSLPIAGYEFDKMIMQFLREQFNLLVGERIAEEVKIRIGSAASMSESTEMRVRGRDMLTGLPREHTVTDNDIREALHRPLKIIIEAIKDTLELTPPELVADIYERGIVLSGGGSLLRGLDQAIAAASEVPVRIVDDPLTAVVRGNGIILEQIDELSMVLLTPTESQEILRTSSMP